MNDNISIIENIRKLLYPFVNGESANYLVALFQKFCGVCPDGTVRFIFVKTYFRAASACGEEIFSLMPVLFWFAYPIAVPFATNFVFLLMFGQIVKDIFQLPRPSAVGTGIVKLGDQHFETEYGLPSTHTMTGYLPLSTVLCLARNGIAVSITAWTFCGVFILSIACSRLFLGVHSVVDVIAGLFLGAIVTWLLHYFGDLYFDDFMYQRPEGIYATIILLALFLYFYPRPRPWRAGFGTSAQIFGSWLGISTSLWYLNNMRPDILEILQKNSVLQSVNSHLELHLKGNFWSNIQVMLLSLAITGLAKVVTKALASAIFVSCAKHLKPFCPHPLEEIDSLGLQVPILKAYQVEVPVRLINYGLLGWAVIILCPILWNYYDFL